MLKCGNVKTERTKRQKNEAKQKPSWSVEEKSCFKVQFMRLFVDMRDKKHIKRGDVIGIVQYLISDVRW